MQFKILAQGADWVVVRKPAGLLVHRMSKGRGLACVQVLRNQLGQHVWPVHRLDRPTSGCLLFALSAEAVAPLHASLAAGTKHYLAHVRGDVAAREPIEIDGRLFIDGVEREAHTTAIRLGGSPEPRSSLVLAIPTTGRTHQIRRHLNRIGHPILMDSSHGDTRVNRWWREEAGHTRLALHCWQLLLTLPDGTPLNVRAPIPADLGRVWCAQPWWPEARLKMAEYTVEEEAA